MNVSDYVLPPCFLPTFHVPVQTFQHVMLVNLSYQGQACSGVRFGSLHASPPAARTAGEAENWENQKTFHSHKDNNMSAKPSLTITRSLCWVFHSVFQIQNPRYEPGWVKAMVKLAFPHWLVEPPVNILFYPNLSISSSKVTHIMKGSCGEHQAAKDLLPMPPA